MSAKKTVVSLVLATICLFYPLGLPVHGLGVDADDPGEAEVAPPAAVPLESKYPGIVIRPINVADTDPNLAGQDVRRHWTFYQPKAKHRGILLVDMPGTQAKQATRESSMRSLLSWATTCLT